MPQLATDIKKPYRSNFCVLIKLGKHSRSITTVFFVWGKNKLMQEAIPFSYSFLLSNHRERLSASQPEIIGVIKISRQTFTSTGLEYGRLKIASIETKEVIPSFFLSFCLSLLLLFWLRCVSFNRGNKGVDTVRSLYLIPSWFILSDKRRPSQLFLSFLVNGLVQFTSSPDRKTGSFCS